MREVLQRLRLLRPQVRLGMKISSLLVVLVNLAIVDNITIRSGRQCLNLINRVVLRVYLINRVFIRLRRQAGLRVLRKSPEPVLLVFLLDEVQALHVPQVRVILL